MDDRGALTQLRLLLARDDGAGLVSALNVAPWPDDSLQLIGDGLVAAVRGGANGSAELARVCVNALRERRWDGDQELAVTLEAALGSGPTPMLRPLPVDLEELSMILEGDPVHGGGRVDLLPATCGLSPPSSTPSRWARSAMRKTTTPIDGCGWTPRGRALGYRDMEWFIADLDDADFADRLARAIAGRGAFRRFKDRLSERPELISRWHAFSGDRQRGRARSWLAAEGYTPVLRHD